MRDHERAITFPKTRRWVMLSFLLFHVMSTMEVTGARMSASLVLTMITLYSALNIAHYSITGVVIFSVDDLREYSPERVRRMMLQSEVLFEILDLKFWEQSPKSIQHMMEGQLFRLPAIFVSFRQCSPSRSHPTGKDLSSWCAIHCGGSRRLPCDHAFNHPFHYLHDIGEAIVPSHILSEGLHPSRNLYVIGI
jgi:hypothetical protein